MASAVFGGAATKPLGGNIGVFIGVPAPPCAAATTAAAAAASCVEAVMGGPIMEPGGVNGANGVVATRAKGDDALCTGLSSDGGRM